MGQTIALPEKPGLLNNFIAVKLHMRIRRLKLLIPAPSSSREVDEANALAQTVFLEEEEELYWTEELVDGQGP